VAERLEAGGYVVGSRRHVAGPGDLVAWKCDRPPLLVECKRGSGSPYENFRPGDRAALRDYAAARGLVPLLAWRKDRGRLAFIDAAEWPTG
jgi:hypothetical protein